MHTQDTEQTKHKPTVIILLGAPGSGKGTQATEICKTFSIPHISTGDLLRQNIKEETVIGKQAKSYVEKGQFPPDSLILDVLFDRISKPDCSKGYLLDGFPRTLAQAHELEDSLNGKVQFIVLSLQVSDEEVVQRLSGRLTCKGCGAIFHKQTNPPQKENICNTCGGELYQRADDNAEVIKERLKVYNVQTKPLQQFYREKGHFTEIDASKSPKEVLQEIKAAIQKQATL